MHLSAWSKASAKLVAETGDELIRQAKETMESMLGSLKAVALGGPSFNWQDGLPDNPTWDQFVDHVRQHESKLLDEPIIVARDAAQQAQL